MPHTPHPRLILASSSRYRAELLARLRIPFQAIVPDIDETPAPGEPAAQLALRLANAKAATIAGTHPGAIVIGSDQVALCDKRILGKPGTMERAHDQLRYMAGKETLFHTAIAVTDGSRTESANVITRCTMRQLDDRQIDIYLRADSPLDTAGSAKAESLGIALMETIASDDPTALIGLPLIALTRLLTGFGLDPLRRQP